jgi:hypothetical protein
MKKIATTTIAIVVIAIVTATATTLRELTKLGDVTDDDFFEDVIACISLSTTKKQV